MPTRNVVLTDHQAELVASLVASGRYQNASEVLRDGLRLIEERADDAAARLQFLREAARVGFADLDAGRFRTVAPEAIEATIAALARQSGQEPTPT
ncbi:MAG: type II toxin-antitoxin system ParD family antitoxin [Acetobacteraceae bacterium]